MAIKAAWTAELKAELGIIVFKYKVDSCDNNPSITDLQVRMG